MTALMWQVRQGRGMEPAERDTPGPGETGPVPLSRPGRPRLGKAFLELLGLQRRDGHEGVGDQSSEAEEIFTLGEKGKGGTR